MIYPFAASTEAAIAINAAIQAGKTILDLYLPEIAAVEKEDGGPLTIADTKSNGIICSALEKTGFPILSEETADTTNRLAVHTVWIVDPLDGTKDFIHHTGEFSVMIGLVQNHIPTLGVVYVPAVEKLYVAEQGKGAYAYDGSMWRPLQVSTVNTLRRARTVVSRHHFSDQDKKFVEALNVKEYVQRGSCGCKIAEVSAGAADVYFTWSKNIKQWDSCAAYRIITEAGGRMTDMSGKELRYNTENIHHMDGILVTNGLLHDEVLTHSLKRS